MGKLLLIMAVFVLLSTAKAQQSDQKIENQIDSGASFVEDQLEKEDQELEEIQNQKRARDKIDYSETKEATAYSDLVTIQKTMLPKSKRFRGMLGLTFLPNDVFFTTLGIDGRLGYDFTETWGVEAEGLFLTSIKGEDLKGLEDTQKIRIENMSSLKNYLGVNMVFTPFYGKTAMFNNKIIPFEIYQTIGIGKVAAGNSSEATAIKLGIGELFSWDKQRAFRLELSFLFYKSKTILNTEQNSNILLLTLGFENFFTKVGDR